MEYFFFFKQYFSLPVLRYPCENMMDPINTLDCWVRELGILGIGWRPMFAGYGGTEKCQQS